MTMLSRLLRFGRRQLHTIVSKEIIKPSSPTPSRLKTYNLSVCDQVVPSTFVPFVAFYPNAVVYDPHDQALNLKIGLSQTLTKYYPFAGRHAQISPAYVDCNDHGAEFVEASIDSKLSDFLQNSQHEDLDQLLPDGRIWNKLNHRTQTDTLIPLAVQVSHFECGGVAVAASLSHKIADASSLLHFLCDWGKLTRVCSKVEKYEKVPVEPEFLSNEKREIKSSGLLMEESNDCITRSIMFPNTKINQLKVKITAMASGSGREITNPTRVEVLTWLLYKCAVTTAATMNSGSFKPSWVSVPTNLRDKIMEPLPENSIGNLVKAMEVQTTNENELKPEFLINELRKQKMEIQSLTNIQAAFASFLNTSLDFDFEKHQTKFENSYICSSVCGFPAYEIDFGWGTPLKAAFLGNIRKNSFILIDAQEGIEAYACLGKQEMDIIQRNPDLLAFC